MHSPVRPQVSPKVGWPWERPLKAGRPLSLHQPLWGDAETGVRTTAGELDYVGQFPDPAVHPEPPVEHFRTICI